MNITITARIIVLIMVIFFSACHDDNDNDNTAPVADAGLDQTAGVIVSDVVVLDGSGSSDADNDTLGYMWSFISVPPGSAAAFDDASSEKPSFTADLVGTYAVQLVVNDGNKNSIPDEVTVIVAAPAPVVAITTPEPLSLFTANPVTVAGNVDDSHAAITVNSIDTPNNNGNYSADIDLAEGSNTVTVIATNSTGLGEDSVTVILKTQPGPVMSITSHRNGFTEGLVFNGCPPIVPANIPTRVHGTITTQNGPPTVDVNGVTATVTELTSNPLLVEFCNKFPNASICNTLDNTRYSFSVDLDLGLGEQLITATGFDTVGGSTTVSVNGVADYCYIAAEGVSSSCPSTGNNTAFRGDNQSKRCHAIDGCSVPIGDLDLRNNPMPLAQFNRVPVEFGDGELPPEEFFVHGQDNTPARELGCNVHDVCYQTCVPANQQDDARLGCDDKMYDLNKAKCREAYPSTCPYTITGPFGGTIPDPVICPLWLAEKSRCFSLAFDYHAGLRAFAKPAYVDRQGQYCQ